MVTCPIDSEVAGEVLGWPLLAWQAVLVHRVLPSCGGFVVYLTVICYDIALIYEHHRNGDKGLAAFCILLMVLPAVISLVFTLASPPPGLQTEEAAIGMSIAKDDLAWIAMQIGNFVLFPVAAVGRYCHQIFWWIEAVFACRAVDDRRTKEALTEARAPSPLELYLFLQAFLHSAPHAVLNILDLLTRNRDPAFQKVSVQAVSIVASLLRMASTATVYRRFEREKICGKEYPWYAKCDQENNENENIEKADKEKLNEEPIYETIEDKHSMVPENIEIRNSEVSDLIQFSPSSRAKPWFGDNDSDSGTSSDYIPPMTTSRRSSARNSDDEYIRPISIIEKVAPRRRETQYTIERVVITPPPAFPAPRPMSLAAWAEKIVENAESIPEWLSAPPRRKHGEEILIEEPDIPRRVPRSFIRGLEPQDAGAALVQYLGWYAFLLSRVLSISIFIHGLPVAAIIVLFSHYQVMLLLLIVPEASTVRRAFYIFLAFIYLFCLMEFKIRFRHVRVWHGFWMLVCAIETIIFTGLWSGLNDDVGGWWKLYIVRVIFGSLLLSYMCFLVYFVYFKPRETIVYVNNKNTSVK